MMITPLSDADCAADKTRVAEAVQSVIDDFGGTDEVARIVPANTHAIRAWKRIGVPFKFHSDLVRAGQDRGISTMTHERLRATRPAPRPKKAYPKRRMSSESSAPGRYEQYDVESAYLAA